jgi:hypothetical protein
MQPSFQPVELVLAGQLPNATQRVGYARMSASGDYNEAVL